MSGFTHNFRSSERGLAAEINLEGAGIETVTEALGEEEARRGPRMRKGEDGEGLTGTDRGSGCAGAVLSQQGHCQVQGLRPEGLGSPRSEVLPGRWKDRARAWTVFVRS